MLSYEGGVLVAFLCWLFGAVMVVVSINSQLERNLNKFGQRLSWITLTPTPLTVDDLQRRAWVKVIRYMLIIGVGLPFVLLSWAQVALFVGAFIYRKSKDLGAPLAVREFRWKLRNVDLTFDQLVKELMKLEDNSDLDYEEYRRGLVADLTERGLKAPPR